MIDQGATDQQKTLEPVHAGEEETPVARWPYWLVMFLRVMAGVSLIKGLYHWAIVCGVEAPSPAGFEAYATPYQVATSGWSKPVPQDSTPTSMPARSIALMCADRSASKGLSR